MGQSTQSVTVAVIDSGVSPCSETEDRILDGFDFVEKNNTNGHYDAYGHDTHVAGTILDCTRGLEVNILPVGSLDDEGNGSDLKISTRNEGDKNGNTADECPAHIDEPIVVVAIDNTGTIAYFSSPGDSVDVSVPGVSILSYYIGNTMAELDGISMAVPHISALAAMLKMYLSDKSVAEIEKYITDYCICGGDELYYGSGSPWTPYFAGE